MEPGHAHATARNDSMFTILKEFGRMLAPRSGVLTTGKAVIQTPHYLGVSSRGVVPHLSQDTFARDTSINGIYVALEDFMERYRNGSPPICEFKVSNGNSPLRHFIALPDETFLVLGARRTPPVEAPPANSNTSTTVAISTSVGFRTLQADDYAEMAENLKADIVIGLGDIPYGRALVPKRMEKAVDRQIDWMQSHVADRTSNASQDAQGKLFAPLLPVSCAKQSFYIQWLEDNIDSIAGLAVYDIESLSDLPDSMTRLPRLGFTTPASPHEVLRHISLGMDLVTMPFVNAATDAGIALDFQFGGSTSSETNSSHAPQSLGIDMWSIDHATDVSPLSHGCDCYACTNHHRAFMQHLLAAKEMLGWVLLQIHNHAIMDRFFLAVRESITAGTFVEDVATFARTYDSQLPEKTGRGPRVRGYQFRSEGPSEPKKNQSSFTVFNNKTAAVTETPPPAAEANAAELEPHGLGRADDSLNG